MATLHVENVPRDLHEALRNRAHEHRKSIAAEVFAILEDNDPTAAELKSRQAFLRRIERIRRRRPMSAGPFPSSEEMQREDRGR